MTGQIRVEVQREFNTLIDMGVRSLEIAKVVKIFHWFSILV